MLKKYLSAARTRPRLLQVLNLIADIRYATIPMLKELKTPATKHICTAPSFAELKELKHLAEPKPGVFALGLEGFKLIGRKFWPPDGGGEHDLTVAKLVLRDITENEATVMYPRFERQRLYPDALLIYRKPGAYRLEFLEVELSPKTDDYLKDKLKKYEALAQDQSLFTDWWPEHKERLGLPPCNIDQFCFGVRVI